MVVNFSAANVRDHPTLILRNLDGTPIQTLGYAFNLEAELYYNEVSSIQFQLPAYVEGVKTPHYDDVVGMRIVDVQGLGQFILINPSTSNDGVREVKTCKGYSLEYEFTFKKIFIEEGTYNFWNPVAQSETVLGIILEYMPSWSAGEIDDRLVGKYRTFEVTDDNVYNFIKSTVQQSYGCVFDFDTYNRRINVVSTESITATKPVSISLDNLAKEIDIDEDTENIYTCLDVNGADGVDIRSVNPTGTNKIYNLEYYMTPVNFSQSMIERYYQWRDYYAQQQQPYNQLTVELSLLEMAIATEEYFIAEAKSKTMAALEAQRNVYIEYLGTYGYNASSSASMSQQLQAANAQIANAKADIAAREARLESLKNEKISVLQQMIAINQSTSWEAFFTPQEILVLDRYVKEDAIEDSTFVAEDIRDYTSADAGKSIMSDTFTFSGGTVNKATVGGRTVYSIRGGSLVSAGTATGVGASVITGAAEVISGRVVITAFMSSNSVFDITAPKASLTVYGNPASMTDNCDETGEGTSLAVSVTAADVYYTQETTEFSRFSVEWDLYAYGAECLRKLAYPSYTFSVSSANFLALEDFSNFRSKLALGNKIYLSPGYTNTLDNFVLQPILVGVKISFENTASLELQFGSTYSLDDPSFNLVDLIEQSVSMGRRLDVSRFNYNQFVSSGANTEVRDFIDSALDVARNQILSSGDMAILWNEAGLYLRKYTQDKSDYMPEQIAMINNMIAFTPDNWETVKMAIGHFVDSNAGDVWGIVAPNIVGTLIAGENLVIEAKDANDQSVLFKVDGSGALLHNASFDLVSNNAHIVMNPALGMGIGYYPIINNGAFDPNHTNFWVEPDGSVHMKGTLEAADGIFSGQLQAATGTFSGNLSAASGSFSGDITGSTGTFTGVVKASDFLDANGNSMMDNGKFDSSYLDLGNITLNGTTGDITLGGNIYITGNIQWNSSNSPVSVQYSSDGVSNWHTTYYTTDYFARYSYDGGSTWTQAVKIQGVDGHNGSDANVTYQNVFNALTNNGTMRGIFYGYNPETGGDQGALYINADYIKTGTLNAMHIVLGDSTAMPVTIYEYYPIYTNWGYQWQYGAHSVPQYGLRIGYGSDGRNDSYGPQMYYCFLNMASLYELRSQVICTEYGAALKFSSEYVCATATGCYASTAFVYGSDSRIKHDIDYDMDAYESFFNKLRPCHFIFNSSSDESKDIGFIAQDVETALTESGMTTREFAGLKIEDTSEYKDFHGLRYDDFIALNTYMIQKLYKRIEALEDEIKNIKEKA